MSSANNMALECVRQFGRSFVYIMKSNGPSIEPCVTPHGTIRVVDFSFFKLYQLFSVTEVTFYDFM